MPYTTLYEECLLPIEKKNLYLDIFIPDFLIAIEVDGNQHEKFNPFFHKSKIEFGKAQYNDSLKEDWCVANNISLLRLKESEKNDEWRERIIDAFR